MTLPTPTLTATVVDGVVRIHGADPVRPPPAPKPRRLRRNRVFMGHRAPGASKRKTSTETAAAFLELRERATQKGLRR